MNTNPLPNSTAKQPLKCIQTSNTDTIFVKGFISTGRQDILPGNGINKTNRNEMYEMKYYYY
jgi:hypothetical protein